MKNTLRNIVQRNEKALRMRSFEDLRIGENSVSEPLTVDGADMVDFAKRYDPQWFHADEEAAKASIFGETVASGIYTAALWRKLDHSINGDVDFICGVAWEDVRWAKAVRAGDVLRATSEILEKRPSASDPTRGVAVFLYGLVNQHGETVFSCRSINLVRTRSAPD
ncbi:MAG: MaoC/PaaZ C-terminal domain-containing protein [Pseudomonadota bacterium]